MSTFLYVWTPDRDVLGRVSIPRPDGIAYDTSHGVNVGNPT